MLESVLGGAFPDALTGSPDYWLEQLRDLPVLELPADRPRPPLHKPEAGVVPWSADVDSDALLAALQVVLGRYTRSLDVPVGVVVADELVVLRAVRERSGRRHRGPVAAHFRDQVACSRSSGVGRVPRVGRLAWVGAGRVLVASSPLRDDCDWGLTVRMCVVVLAGLV